jgi:hypothetical protein
MHSMPSVSLSPNSQHLICQSMDNQIVSYTCKDKLRGNSKKTFKGHNTAGYACQVGSRGSWGSRSGAWRARLRLRRLRRLARHPAHAPASPRPPRRPTSRRTGAT